MTLDFRGDSSQDECILLGFDDESFDFNASTPGRLYSTPIKDEPIDVIFNESFSSIFGTFWTVQAVITLKFSKIGSQTLLSTV